MAGEFIVGTGGQFRMAPDGSFDKCGELCCALLGNDAFEVSISLEAARRTTCVGTGGGTGGSKWTHLVNIDGTYTLDQDTFFSIPIPGAYIGGGGPVATGLRRTTYNGIDDDCTGTINTETDHTYVTVRLGIDPDCCVINTVEVYAAQSSLGNTQLMFRWLKGNHGGVPAEFGDVLTNDFTSAGSPLTGGTVSVNKL
jgi:hypothetical protein